MEFERPKPSHTDADGRVHVLDTDNLRETIISPDFTRHAERRLPSFALHTAPLPGERYVLNTLLSTGDRLGLPLHITDGPEVVLSFGPGIDEGTPYQNDFAARRVLASDRSGRMYSAEYYDYAIEVWTQTGRRIAGFQGPLLNEKPPSPGPFTDDNPPVNAILAIRVDDDQRLWVLATHRRDDWREHWEERVARDGSVSLRPIHESPRYTSTTRIDVIDVNSGTRIASGDVDAVIEAFAGDGLGIDTRFTESEIPRVVTWRMTVDVPDGSEND